MHLMVILVLHLLKLERRGKIVSEEAFEKLICEYDHPESCEIYRHTSAILRDMRF